MSGTTLPTVITTAGLQPQSPQSLLAQLIAAVSALVPGYTANLPASLIEDVSSTAVAAVALCDAARVELVNSLTPYGANAFILNQLGQIYGAQLGQAQNTSVNVVFTGTPGYVVQVGFLVSDGTNQYVVQDGGAIGSGGTTALLFAVAVNSGTFPVPAGTVTQVVTSLPTGVTLTVSNPAAGTPATTTTSESDYRQQVIQAGLATAQGMPAFLKTLLYNVPGVQPRLVSVQAQVGGGWKILVGGGDPYQVAGAIYEGLFDVSTLVGSTLGVGGVTNANPGVVTTLLNHGYATGQVVHIAGVQGMTAVNGGPYTITVLTPTTFSIAINTTSFGTYTTGGVVTPNLRNQLVSIVAYPDTYSIPFVLPPSQSVFVDVTWNTNSTNIVSAAAVAQLGSAAITNYVNSIPVSAPINVFEMQSVFQIAIAGIVPTASLTRMIFSVSINGIGVSPESGTGIITGDPESYFLVAPAGVVVTQG